jgi:hypothetical protein
MTHHYQYVPVLRWKGAERVALRNLDPEVKLHITPIIEFVPREFETKVLSVALSTKAKEVASNWGWQKQLFADFCLLGEDCATRSVHRFLEQTASYNLHVGLVTGLHRAPSFQAALSAASLRPSCELCVRVHASELRQTGFQSALQTLLTQLGKAPSDVHLAIDLGALVDPVPSVASYFSFLPSINQWRSLALVAGAFPKDLSQLEKNRQHVLPRNDWLLWRDHVVSTTSRIPAFGDYSVQHGIFEEQQGNQRNFSASIRYTSAEHWVIMRGEGVHNEDGPGYAQWPANAQLLCGRPEFCGANFSFGDDYIRKMSLEMRKTGGPTGWLAAGINHHLTFVVRQIGQLFATLGSAASSLG